MIDGEVDGTGWKKEVMTTAGGGGGVLKGKKRPAGNPS